MVPALFIIVILASIAICHWIAKKRGVNPVFWGLMGALFGPLAIPFVFLVRPK
jgi:uncharacterized membrane protein